MTRDVARWQRLAHGLHRRGVPLAPRLSETLVGGVPATLVRSDIDIGRYLALARPGDPAR